MGSHCFALVLLATLEALASMASLVCQTRLESEPESVAGLEAGRTKSLCSS